jgi:putative nucleotidyltransferase with HDIG domain
MTPDDDPRVEELHREAPTRAAEPLTRRDRLAESGIALALVGAMGAMVLMLPAPDTSSLWLAGVLLGVHIAAHRVRFAVGSCYATPTPIAVVPMLLLLHPALVPALIAASSIAVRMPDYLRRRVHPDHAVLAFGDAWYSVGPALVLALAGPSHPTLEAWPIYAAALGAQLLADNLVMTIRLWLALGVPPELQLRMQLVGFGIDGALAPVGLLVALTARAEPAAVVLVLPLLGLLMALGREREQRIQHALQLSEAYRGSALLMGEMLEADDPYTGGEHSKGVLSLTVDVGQELGLDAREQRELEFGALLHDIGKLRTPEEILNKPGKLDPAEWAVIKRHPLDGQEMLDRIGGVLAEVGLVVRGHHERWDGGGYPDGLVGADIPLAARIICACDAYSAMTTDRPYRKAMPIEDALAELRKCAGSQFDPRVVDALERVVLRDAPRGISTLLAA